MSPRGTAPSGIEAGGGGDDASLNRLDTAPVHDAGAAENSGSQVDSAVVSIGIGALLLARLPLLGVRTFDPDEFEHAHAAWNVFRGLLPYRDFFEHHTPWYYFTLSPFFHWFRVDQSFDSARRFLLFVRLLSLALTAVSLAVLVFIGRLVASRRAGLLAGLFLAVQPLVINKTLEIRPDVAALPFFIGGLWSLLSAMSDSSLEPGRSRRWFLIGGLFLGAAVMYTQKMMFALPGVFLGLALWVVAGGRHARTTRTLAVLAALGGVAAPILLTWIGFALRHGGGPFVYDNFLLNARWHIRSDRHLTQVLRSSWPILSLASIGVLRRGSLDHGRLLLLCTLGSLVAGVAVVPAAYEQYYLPPLAIASLFAADGLLFLVELAREPLRAPLVVGTTIVLLARAVAELASASAYRNEAQLARLRYVLEHTGPTDTVLDGWLGTGVFHPQPLYYAFMHRELWASLPESEHEAYLGALESGKVKPALITADRDLLRLGPRFVHFLYRDYVTDNRLFFSPAVRLGRWPSPAHRP